MNDLVLKADCRIHGIDPVMIGDSCGRTDGQAGTVLDYRQEGNRLFVLAVPSELLSSEWFAKMYRGEFQRDRLR